MTKLITFVILIKNYKCNPIVKEISQSELAVMNVLWNSHLITSHEIVTELQKEFEWHEKTIKTLTNRLIKKEAIGFTKEGRAYLYYSKVNQQDYQLRESKSFLKRLFSGKLSPLIAGFSRENILSKEDINELQQLIDDWKKENK